MIRKFLLRAALIVASLLLVLLGAEILLRNVPFLLPQGAYYGSGVFEPELGFFLPRSTVIYNKARYLERTPNSDGFQDIEHAPENPDGVIRIGFFGDSYVESVQVKLTEVFFRRLPDKIEGRQIETLGFGLSGLGTLHSHLLYRKFGRRYNLDLVIYVFVNNDPGDHNYKIQRSRHGLTTPRPTGLLADNSRGYQIHYPQAPSPARRAAMTAKSHSLLARVVYSRLQVLLTQQTHRKTQHQLPTQDDPPSAWPQALQAQAGVLTRRILVQWQKDVRGANQRFAILYVPLEREVADPRHSDSWRSWLFDTCRTLGIPLIDPTAALHACHAAGTAVYEDHWTPEGHLVVASVLTAQLAELGYAEVAGVCHIGTPP